MFIYNFLSYHYFQWGIAMPQVKQKAPAHPIVGDFFLRLSGKLPLLSMKTTDIFERERTYVRWAPAEYRSILYHYT